MKYLKIFESYYKDLTPYTYDSVYNSNTVNIGWLDTKHDFPKGNVDKEIIEKIKNLPDSARFKGYHYCEFCDHNRFNAELKTSVNKKITYKGVTYCFPGLLPHYIEKHNYLPPIEFLDAINAINK